MINRANGEVLIPYTRRSIFINNGIIFPTAQKMKFSIKDFFSNCDQIHSFLRIWSPLLEKSLMENFTFCAASCGAHNPIFSMEPIVTVNTFHCVKFEIYILSRSIILDMMHFCYITKVE